MTDARSLALTALMTAQRRRAFIADVLDELFSSHAVTPQDKRLAAHLAHGVLRRKATLDALLTPLVNRPLAHVEPPVLEVLRLGAYQLALMDGIPPRAAVHATVELATVIQKPAVKGFINGILRRVSEIVTDEVETVPGRAALPLDTAEVTYRRLRRAVFDEPGTAKYLAAAFSLPRWLAERWRERFGFEECCRLGFHFNAPPAVWLRVNSLRVDRETYRLRLAAALMDAEPGEHPQSLKLHGPASIVDLPGYSDGDFAVQDHASMLVATAVNVRPGMRVLDLCAAPGGKTTHLAEILRDRGEIVACDIDSARLATVESLARRLGLTCIRTHRLSKFEAPPPGPFDAALVDAPCSNTGVLGRRPEVRWRLQPREFPHLTQLQTELLLAAIERVKPGGSIVYSTCSIEPEENAHLVHSVARALKLRIAAEHQSVPGRPGDGGYWARLRKP